MNYEKQLNTWQEMMNDTNIFFVSCLPSLEEINIVKRWKLHSKFNGRLKISRHGEGISTFILTLMSSHFEIFQLTLIWQDTTENVTGNVQYREKMLLKTRELTTGDKFKSFDPRLRKFEGIPH